MNKDQTKAKDREAALEDKLDLANIRIGQLEGAIKGALPHLANLEEMADLWVTEHPKLGPNPKWLLNNARQVIAKLKELMGEKP